MAEPLPACPRCGVPPTWMRTTSGELFGCDCDCVDMRLAPSAPEFFRSTVRADVEARWRKAASHKGGVARCA